MNKRLNNCSLRILWAETHDFLRQYNNGTKRKSGKIESFWTAELFCLNVLRLSVVLNIVIIYIALSPHIRKTRQIKFPLSLGSLTTDESEKLRMALSGYHSTNYRKPLSGERYSSGSQYRSAPFVLKLHAFNLRYHELLIRPISTEKPVMYIYWYALQTFEQAPWWGYKDSKRTPPEKEDTGNCGEKSMQKPLTFLDCSVKC